MSRLVNVIKVYLLSQKMNLSFVSLFIEFVFCSRKIQASLFILLFGVGIATVTDLQLNFLGSILAILAIVTTCIAQIVSFDNWTMALCSFVVS